MTEQPRQPWLKIASEPTEIPRRPDDDELDRAESLVSLRRQGFDQLVQTLEVQLFPIEVVQRNPT